MPIPIEWMLVIALYLAAPVWVIVWMIMYSFREWWARR